MSKGVKKWSKTSKDFIYVSKDDTVSLSFTLNVDDQKELKAFLPLLEEAKKDVEEELRK